MTPTERANFVGAMVQALEESTIADHGRRLTSLERFRYLATGIGIGVTSAASVLLAAPHI